MRNGNVIVILMANEKLPTSTSSINNAARDICFNRKEGKVNYSILNYPRLTWKTSNVLNQFAQSLQDIKS